MTRWLDKTNEIQASLLAELAFKVAESGFSDHDRLNQLKIDFCRQHALSWMPRNSDIIDALPPDRRAQFIPELRLKKVRSISGVNVIGVMSSPRGCPHGRCVFCPMEKGFPMSYTSGEPAAMRGIQFGYDPHKQITSRLHQLKSIGHEPSKVELVVQGGTFLAAPQGYQENFIRQCLDAINGSESRNLEDAKSRAETSEIRNVGLTIETKPDWCKEQHVNQMLKFGATRVEIGVQIIDDYIYQITNRGHTVEDVVESFRIAKDAGLKIVAHMMPGLPGSNFEKDLASFHILFQDARFCPDMIKIYPCLVMEGTELYDWWKQGKYTPYNTEQASDLIAQVKEFVPPWVRIMRVHREFPVHLVIDGVKNGNLREIATDKLAAKGKRCRCIRCREVGHRDLKESVSVSSENLRITKVEYAASEGTELFISKEEPEKDVLIGYIRLRIPSSKAERPEVTPQTAIVRELHVFGPEVPIGKKCATAWQHKGLGQELLAAAENSAKEKGSNKILVLSALGTRQYYRKAGYTNHGAFMRKLL